MKMSRKEEKLLEANLVKQLEKQEIQGIMKGYFSGIETIYSLILGIDYENDFIDMPDDIEYHPFTFEQIVEFCRLTLGEEQAIKMEKQAKEQYQE